MLRATSTRTSRLLCVVVFCLCGALWLYPWGPGETLEPEAPCLESRNWEDNIGGSCYQGLCAPVIDIVYTWVNGSDPRMAEALRRVKDALLIKQGLTATPKCNSTQDPEKDDCWKDDATANRYIDNEELRYSLRSVEKFAPWVRHIFIVTNGQIPYWLDIEHPKITVVPHNVIFTNKSHLPTFSSPAIEANLHNIPGLSRHWIYLNDDVMFGETVWPDDFVTNGKGQKVFLAWAVPDCTEGCPSSWSGDGFCDIACNTTSCDFDGGDCIGPNVTFGGGWGGSYWGNYGNNNRGSATSYCSASCPDPWLGDKYCDRGCLLEECGMDAGDCGLEEVFNGLVGTSLSDVNRTGLIEVDIEYGLFAFYFNLSSLLEPEQFITDVYHDNNQLIRSAVLRRNSKVLIVMLRHESQTAKLSIIWGDTKGNTDNATLLLNVVKEVTESEPEVESQPSTDEPENAPTTGDGGATPEVVLDINTFFDEWGKENKRRHVSAGQEGEESGKKRIRVYSNERTESKRSSGEFLYRATIEEEESGKSDGNLKILDAILEEWPEKATKRIEGHKKLMGEKNFQSFIQTAKKGESWRDDETLLPPKVEDFTTKLDSLASSLSKGSEDSEDSEEAELLLTKSKTREFSNFAEQVLRDPFFAPFLDLTTLASKKRDNYGDSLKHVNKLLNKEFGNDPRRVPAHMPHFIDTEILVKMHNLWPEEFNKTSSNQLRASDDMQFAFSYFYYLMSERVEFDFHDVWTNKLDLDGDGVLSSIEVRAQVTLLYKETAFEEMMEKWGNCSIKYKEEGEGEEREGEASAEDNGDMDEEGEVGEEEEGVRQKEERGYKERRNEEEDGENEGENDGENEGEIEGENEGGNEDEEELEGGKVKPFVPITKKMLMSCEVFPDIEQKYKKFLKNKFEIQELDDVAFKMLPTDAPRVARMLDEIVASPKKIHLPQRQHGSQRRRERARGS
eukprot:TRINITY_DN1356_c0_g3_i1.p1 TRINITY_DN1356_c0_g3~~TRINITY_DN1356_c0_g3_i1.p1  ORF type:complete len:957 (-),score=219.28 TRINITY_DN1356_c0_g3_i1:368-3238(-)